jgi:archaellum biogenesis ATPase FlaH
MRRNKRTGDLEVDSFDISDNYGHISEGYTRGGLPSDREELALCHSWNQIGESCRDVEWVWQNYIAKGFLTMLAGYSGVGKSFLLLRLCGCITENWSFPDGSYYQDERGSVLWAEGEAAQKLNFSRGMKMGLDLSRFLFPFDDPFVDYDMEKIEHNQKLADFLYHPEVKILVIDSLSGVHNNDENSSDMNRNIKFLAKLAQETNKPIVITHHLKKKSVNDEKEITLERVRGSSAIVQNTRLVIGIDTPERDQNYKRVKVLKSNLSEIPEPFAFRITDGQVNFMPYTKTHESKSQRDQAKEYLETSLEDGPRKANELITGAETQGIAKRTLLYAKKELGIRSERVGSSNGYFQWILPSQSLEKNTE